MLTPFMFWSMAAMAGVLAIYAFIDNENRILAHVFAGVAALILFFLLGSIMITGNVADVVPLASNQTTNNSTVSYAYSNVEVATQDTTVGWLFIFLGVGMCFMVFMHITELASELIDRRGRPWWEEYDDDDD